MGNNHISFEDEVSRGECSRYITNLLRNNNLNWYSSASIKKPEVFIRPNGNYEWENTSSKISRVSMQIKDNSISFGVSGYSPRRILDTYSTFKNKDYTYHDKEGNSSPQEAVQNEEKVKGPSGRWWLTKPLNNLEDVIREFKDIENLLI